MCKPTEKYIHVQLVVLSKVSQTHTLTQTIAHVQTPAHRHTQRPQAGRSGMSLLVCARHGLQETGQLVCNPDGRLPQLWPGTSHSSAALHTRLTFLLPWLPLPSLHLCAWERQHGAAGSAGPIHTPPLQLQLNDALCGKGADSCTSFCRAVRDNKQQS